MDNEMIERMAIAIKEVQWGTRVAWKDCEETFKTIKRQQAIAAIKAIREPTHKMKSAGRLENGSKNIWRAMVNAVIGDE